SPRWRARAPRCWRRTWSSASRTCSSFAPRSTSRRGRSRGSAASATPGVVTNPGRRSAPSRGPASLETTREIPATSKPLPRDASGIYPVASVYNAALDRHEAVVGASGAMAVRVADGADEALGSRADAPAAGDLSGAHTLIAIMKESVRLLRQQADL